VSFVDSFSIVSKRVWYVLTTLTDTSKGIQSSWFLFKLAIQLFIPSSCASYVLIYDNEHNKICYKHIIKNVKYIPSKFLFS
jgi:hypothetical protein